MRNTIQVPFLDLRFQYETIQPELEAAALRVLRSGHYILGPELAALEMQFAEYLNVSHAVGVASGTDALELALRALEIGPGDDVLTVANISAPTICAILATGARPVLIDIDPDTFNMSPESLERYLKTGSERHRAKVVLPVHLYGRMADMKSIREIAKRFDLKVVVDAAQAHGARDGDDFAGTMGDIGCFSMYPTKNLGACGDAGMVVTKDAVTDRRLRMLRNYGETSRYDNRETGINSRLDEIQAALLQVKLKYLNQWTERRRAIALKYHQTFISIGLLSACQVVHKPESHVYHLYVITVGDREEFRNELLDMGIATAVHYPRPIHHQPALRNQCLVGGRLEFTEWACRSVVSLPLYPEMTDEQVDLVCNSVSTLVRSRRWIHQNTA